MRAIAASVLFFEALLVLLAIPVAITLHDTDPTAAVVVGAVIASACVATAGRLGHPSGYRIGWGLQAVVVACGLVVPVMFFLGGLFAVLWFVGLRVGRKGEQIHAQLAEAAAQEDRPDPRSPGAEPGQGQVRATAPGDPVAEGPDTPR